MKVCMGALCSILQLPVYLKILKFLKSQKKRLAKWSITHSLGIWKKARHEKSWLNDTVPQHTLYTAEQVTEERTPQLMSKEF